MVFINVEIHFEQNKKAEIDELAVIVPWKISSAF